MSENDTLQELPSLLLPWYKENKRDLPWRADQEPYHIWLSEIMLQQTRVEAVRGYYTRFLQALPTVEELASCDDDRLRKLWEGLGYYTRDRIHLQKCSYFLFSELGRSCYNIRHYFLSTISISNIRGLYEGMEPPEPDEP